MGTGTRGALLTHASFVPPYTRLNKWGKELGKNTRALTPPSTFFIALNPLSQPPQRNTAAPYSFSRWRASLSLSHTPVVVSFHPRGGATPSKSTGGGAAGANMRRGAL